MNEQLQLQINNNLVDIAEKLGRIDERTKVMPELIERVNKHENELWFARGGVKVLSVLWAGLAALVGWFVEIHYGRK